MSNSPHMLWPFINQIILMFLFVFLPFIRQYENKIHQISSQNKLSCQFWQHVLIMLKIRVNLSIWGRKTQITCTILSKCH